MSAPSLPNLLHSRGRGGRPLRRGRGGASSSAAVHPDEIVQRTDTDAAVSRLSAVELGYLDDPYARFFAQGSGPGDRRLPIINRGEWGLEPPTSGVMLTGLQVLMRGRQRWMGLSRDFYPMARRRGRRGRSSRWVPGATRGR